MGLLSILETLGHAATAARILKPVVGEALETIDRVGAYIAGNEVELPDLPETLLSEIETERLRVRSGL